jgi:hypothetical protein
MPNEPLALALVPPDALDDAEYQALCDTLAQSARGRAFLAEYARRNRHAETEQLLAAIARIEARLRADASAVQRLRDDLRVLLIAIRLARPEIDAADPAAKAEKLAKLLDLLESRIDAMSETKPVALFPSTDEAPVAHLAIVQPPEKPELPAAPAAIVPATLPRDPLAAIMALSEEERIALFT